MEAINHDANGNDIDNKHQAFTYNAANQPTNVTVNTAQFRPPTQEALAYRGGGQSQLIKDGAATVQQNALGISARGTGTTHYPRAADGTLISQRTPTQDKRRNYLYDANGSVVGLSNPSGQLSTSYRYDAYGHPLNKTPKGDENPFGFAGMYMAGVALDGVLCGALLAAETGLYDPEDGRYTQLGGPWALATGFPKIVSGLFVNDGFVRPAGAIATGVPKIISELAEIVHDVPVKGATDLLRATNIVGLFVLSHELNQALEKQVPCNELLAPRKVFDPLFGGPCAPALGDGFAGF